jgi:hypothetical protein
VLGCETRFEMLARPDTKNFVGERLTDALNASEVHDHFAKLLEPDEQASGLRSGHEPHAMLEEPEDSARSVELLGDSIDLIANTIGPVKNTAR